MLLHSPHLARDRYHLVEESLGELLARKMTLTAEETRGLLLPIARALARVHACGPAADVWSLGVVAYQCPTGVLPLEQWSPNEQGQAVRGAQVPGSLDPTADSPPAVRLQLEQNWEW